MSDPIELTVKLTPQDYGWDVDVQSGMMRSTMVRGTLTEAFFAAMDDARWMILGPDVEGSDQ